MENTKKTNAAQLYEMSMVKSLFPFIYEGRRKGTNIIAFVLIVWLMLSPVIGTFTALARYLPLWLNLQQPLSVITHMDISMRLMLGFVLWQGIGWLIYALSHETFKHITLSGIWEFIKKNLWQTLLALLFTLVTLSAFTQSANLAGAISDVTSPRTEPLVRIIGYAALFITLMLMDDRKLKGALMYWFAGVTLFGAVVMALQYIKWPFVTQFLLLTDTMMYVFDNINFSAYYLTMGITVLAGMFMYEKKWWKCLLIAVAFLFECWVLIQNDTLGCFIAVVATLIIGVWFFAYAFKKPVWKSVMPLALMALLALSMTIAPNSLYGSENVEKNAKTLVNDSVKIVAAVFKLEVNGEKLDKDDMNQVGTQRLGLWKYAMQFISERPLLGWGPEQLDVLYDTRATDLYYPSDRPHNEFIQCAAFYGIPACLIYMAALIIIFAQQIKRVKKLSPFTMIAACGLIGYMISAQFGMSLYYITPCYVFLLALSATPPPAEPQEIPALECEAAAEVVSDTTPDNACTDK